jgi:adenine phosphoribosyltransferase
VVIKTARGDLEHLRDSLDACAVLKRGDYDYFVHPLTDGVPRVSPQLLAEAIDALASRAPRDFDVIVTAEAMGIPMAAGLSMRLQKPYAIVRKRSYGLEGEVAVEQRTGYSQSTLYVNGVDQGDKILLVDDVVSTGGTLRAVAEAAKRKGAKVVQVLVVFSKLRDLRPLALELGAPVSALMTVEIANGQLREIQPA